MQCSAGQATHLTPSLTYLPPHSVHSLGAHSRVSTIEVSTGSSVSTLQVRYIVSTLVPCVPVRKYYWTCLSLSFFWIEGPRLHGGRLPMQVAWSLARISSLFFIPPGRRVDDTHSEGKEFTGTAVWSTYRSALEPMI